ncbi:MAG: hypothetical protein M3N52_12065 [Actinomycetota bacterium]|nr:hypothetical protein [Actinomycetota bacterium]
MAIQAAKVSDVIAWARSDWPSLPEWVRTAYEAGGLLFTHDCIVISTPEGDMRGDLGDWLIRGVKGELYPCKPDIFEATYEPA